MKIQFLNQPIGPPLKLDLEVIRAEEMAVDKLPYGKFNPQASQAAAEAKALILKARAAKA